MTTTTLNDLCRILNCNLQDIATYIPSETDQSHNCKKGIMREDEIMALVKCPECGKEISDKASNCPGCGYPIESQKIEVLGPSSYFPFSSSSIASS